MFIAVVDRNSINIEGSELITSGSVKTNFVQFQFSDDWEGLTKTAIFQTKKVSIPVILDDEDKVAIPWEAMAFVKEEIKIGVYGVRFDDESTEDTDEEIVLPTIWGSLGKVVEGVKVENPPITAPTKDSYLELLDYIKDLQPGGGGGTSGEDGATFIPSVSSDGTLEWTNDKGLPNPDPVNIKGTDGIDGVDGADGKDGQDGVTFTPSVSPDGTLSWSNNNGLANPNPVNIKGDQGPPGDEYLVLNSIFESIPSLGTMSVDNSDFNRTPFVGDVFSGIVTCEDITYYVHGIAVTVSDAQSVIDIQTVTKLTGEDGSSGDSSGPVNWEDINGRPDLSNVSSMKIVLITLDANSWGDNTQTVSVPGISADESAQMIFPTPAISSQKAFYKANVYCSGQAENALTFEADTTPSVDLTVYVGISEGSNGDI